MSRVFTSILLFFCFFSTVFAQSNFYVLHPETSNWWNDPATIEESTIKLRQQGLFTQVELFLTMSARGTSFETQDNCEIVLDFSLPKDALVIDSWLWFNGEIIVADLIDRWTASAIYESYVERNTDPSLLVKNSETEYQLRVFPLMAYDSRKVKITYLVPFNWSKTTVYSYLPIEILKKSLNPFDHFDLFIYDETNWENGQLREFPNQSYTTGQDEEGSYRQTQITNEQFQNKLSIEFPSPIGESGIYVEKLETGPDEGVYQLAVLPNRALGIEKGKNVTILVDFLSENSPIEPVEFLPQLRNYLLTNLSNYDKFNLIFSCPNIGQVSQEWIEGDTASIEATMASIEESILCSYSDLSTIMFKGINFINTQEEKGDILVIANTGMYGHEEFSDFLTEAMIGLMDSSISINICDFQDQNFSTYWIGGQYYRGNEFFYKKLTQQTGGVYFSTYYEHLSLSTGVEKAFYHLGIPIYGTDLYTSAQDGFCHSRYYLSNTDILNPINKPILQVGKYAGTFPFQVEFSGFVENEIYQTSAELQVTEVSESSFLAERIWAGARLLDWEQQVQSSSLVPLIIEQSMEDRILTLYTAFLCLEPEAEDGEWTGNNDDNIGDDDDILIATDEIKTDAPTISVFPNPFSHSTTIHLNVNDIAEGKTVQIQIFDMLGQQIEDLEATLVQGELKVEWDASAKGLTSGIYIIVITIDGKTYTQKVQFTRKV